MRIVTSSFMLILFAVSSVGLGQLTAVSPREFADVEMPGAADLTGVPSYRFQQVYDASDFAHLGTGPLSITRIDWRPDGDVAEPLETPSPQWTMNMSTTSREPGGLSSTFADNLGTNVATVIDGPVTIKTQNLGPAGGPKAFDYGVDLTTPFTFDPSDGNLLMDLTVTDSVGPLLLDFNFSSNEMTSFYWTGALGPDSPVAGGDQWGGHALQFTVVPEPTSCVLMEFGIGACVLLTRRGRND